MKIILAMLLLSLSACDLHEVCKEGPGKVISVDLVYSKTGDYGSTSRYIIVQYDDGTRDRIRSDTDVVGDTGEYKSCHVFSGKRKIE